MRWVYSAIIARKEEMRVDYRLRRSSTHRRARDVDAGAGGAAPVVDGQTRLSYDKSPI